MRHARSLLETSRLKVYEVAERVGYRDVKYFDRVFKKETGLSPEQYRKRFSQ
jgi:two-component system response regulator YesN